VLRFEIPLGKYLYRRQITELEERQRYKREEGFESRGR
jgi:hypothetical protein